jgi:hypothetical protein
MRSLIIPDIHHHTGNADYWLNGQRFDRVTAKTSSIDRRQSLSGHGRVGIVVARWHPYFKRT